MKPKPTNRLITGFLRKNLFSTSVVLSLGLSAVAAAQSISVNFGANQSSSSITESGKNTGALSVAGNRWNNTTVNGGGTLVGLIDSTGVATTGSVTWTAQNTWQSGSTGATATSENGDLTKGYLDDSGSGWTVNMVTPYLLNNIFAIHATDQGNPATMSAVSVNGVFVKGNGTLTIGATGSLDSWSAANWTNVDTLSESTHFLRINNQPQVSLAGLNGSPGRAALAGIQIENAYAGTLAYWDIDGTTLGAGGGAAPTGVWNAANANWSTSQAGDVATTTWTTGNAAVFSAGTNATGTYSVLVQGAQSVDAVWARNGLVTLGDGGSGAALTLTGTAVLRGDSGLTVDIPVSASSLTTAGAVTLNNATNAVSGLATIYGTTTLGANHTFGSLAGGGTLVLGTRTLNVGGDNTDTTFAGLITGTAALTKSGTGRMTILNNITGFTGTTTVSAGVLRVGGGGGTGSIGGSLTGSGIIEFFRNDTGTVTIANNISGAGTLRFLGSNVSGQSMYDFSGTTSSFTGSVSIDDSRLRIDPTDFANSATVSVLDGGQAWFQGGVHAENYTINGNGWTEGSGQLGAIRMENTANVTGSVTVASASRMVAWSGAAGTVSGALLGSANLELNFAANTTANGTFTLTNTAGYLGNLILSRGTVNVGALGGGLSVSVGTANLSGAVAGTTSIASGILNLNSGATIATPTVTGGAINLNAGASISGALTMPTGTGLGLGGGSLAGGLTLGATGTDTHTLTFSAPITVNGNFTASGTQTVNLVIQPPVGGTVTLLNYTGTGSDPVDSNLVNNFVLAGVGTTARSATFTDTGSSITVGVGNVALAWVGADGTNPTFWNAGSTSSVNWSGGDTRYYNGDAVTFDDTATGTNVAMQALLTPSAVTFNNTTKNYTVTGAAGTGITGNASLTKSGAGTLTLGGPASNFTGPVVINQGLLNLSNGEALGFNSGITIHSGGALNFNGHAPANQGRHYSWTIAGNGADGIGGVGAIYTTGGDIFQNGGVKNLTLSGNAEIGGNNGRFDVGLSGGVAGTINGGGFTLTKVGSNPMVLRAPATNITYVVNAGRLSFEDFDSSSGTNAIVVNNAGSALGTWGPRTIANNVTLNAGTQLISIGGGTGTWSGAITATGAVNIQTDDQMVIGGNFAAAGDVAKNGSNQLTVAGSLVGSGGVLNHNAGTLQLGNLGATGSISGFATINLGNNTLFRGRLSGANATINSNFTFANDASEVRQHGGTATDTLTLTGTLGASTTTGRLRATFGRLVLGAGANATVREVSVQGTPAVGRGVVEVATGASITSPWFNIGEEGSNSGILNVSGGTLTALTGGAPGNTAVRIGHWNNNSATIPSALNVTAGLFNASAANLITCVGWDGYGIMTVGGGANPAIARVHALELDANGDSSTYNDTLTMLPNGTLEVGPGGISSASTNDYVILSGGTIQGVANATWAARTDATAATTSFLSVNSGVLVTQTGALTGTGTIEKTGPGLLQVSGGAFAGTLTSSGGTLHLGSTAWSSGTFTLRSAAGGVIQPGTPATAATITVNALALNGGSPTFRASYNGGSFGDRYLVSTANAFTVETATALTVIPGSDLFVGDKIPLIDYDGTIGGAAGFAGLSATAAGNPHYQLSLENDAENTVVNVVIDSLDSVTWIGNIRGTWDVDTTSNWETFSNTLTSKYYDLDAVKFNDQGAATPVVTLVGSIRPSSLEFDAEADYTLQGAPLIGPTNFRKFNTGTVTLLNNNTYTGPVTINGGRVRVGNGGTTGSLGGAGDIALGISGTLEFNRADAQTLARRINNGGTVVKNGSGNLTWTASGNNANVTVNAGALLARGGGFSTGFLADRTITVNAGATLDTTVHSMGSGIGGGGNPPAVVLNGGNWILNGEQYMQFLTMNAGTTTRVGSLDGIRTLGGSIYTIQAASASSVIDSPLNLVYGVNLAVENGDAVNDLVISGNIGNSGVITKTGAGRLQITGANTSTGGMSLNGGSLEVASIADAGGVGSLGVYTTGSPGYLGIANNATFRYTGTGSQTSARNLWIDTGNETKTIEVVSETASITFSGTGGNINKPFTKTGAGALTLADVINPGATVTVAAGRLTLNGVNTYTGDTTVSGGVLAVNGSSIADGGDLYVANSGVVEVTGVETVEALYINGVQQIAGTYGATGSGATFINNTHFSGTGVVNVLTGALPPYQSWAQAKGLDGTSGKDPALTADPDGDGVINLLEFYLDGHPLTNNGAVLPQADLTDPLYLKFTFKRLDEAEGDVISQVMQFGADLAGWVDVTLPAASFTHTSGPANGVIVTVVENGAAADDITVAIPRTYEVGGKLFGRVRVVK